MSLDVEVSEVIERIVVIKLSCKSARLLQGMMQNPLCDEEPLEISNLRKEIFEGLRSKNGNIL